MAERVASEMIGRFEAVVLDHDAGVTDNGKDQIAISFGFKDAKGCDRIVWSYLYFTEATLESEYGPLYALKNLGWDPDENGWAVEQLARKTAANPKGGVLVGRKASITIEDEEYEGKHRAKIAWINAPGGGGVKQRAETHPDGLTGWADRVRSRAKGEAPKATTMPSGEKRSQAPVSRGGGPVTDPSLPDDDIPW